MDVPLRPRLSHQAKQTNKNGSLTTMTSLILPTDITTAMLSDKKTKNSIVYTSGGDSFFGIFPHVSNTFPSGQICLKLGFAGFGPLKSGAFGLRHIWEKHSTEINATNALDIVLFLEKVISAGSVVIIDNNKDPDKPLILESKTGMAVVGLNNGTYYITSAYCRSSHKGTVVGNL